MNHSFPKFHIIGGNLNYNEDVIVYYFSTNVVLARWLKVGPVTTSIVDDVEFKVET